MLLFFCGALLCSLQQPRKGTFAVTAVGVPGSIVELEAMPRPFRKLVALDLEDTAATVIEALKKHKSS